MAPIRFTVNQLRVAKMPRIKHITVSRYKHNTFVVNLDSDGLIFKTNGLNRAQEIASEYADRYGKLGYAVKYTIDCR